MKSDELIELRQWLAENVMGWEFHQPATMYYHSSPYYRQFVGDIYCSKGDENTWHPDTDLNQAFKLVDKMIEKGFDMFDVHYAPHLGKWVAACEKQHSKILCEKKADTPALAICLAIRKALTEDYN